MEQSLRAQVRAGDPDAFGQLFDDHASAVHRHAVRVTGNWPTADDIVSLTFRVFDRSTLAHLGTRTTALLDIGVTDRLGRAPAHT